MYQVPRVFTEAHEKGFPGFAVVGNPRILLLPSDPTKTVPASRYAHESIINGRTPHAEKKTAERDMGYWTNRAEIIFSFTKTWEYAAVIGGMPVVLRTNSPHLANFWRRNWWLVDPKAVRIAQAQYGIPYVTMRAVVIQSKDHTLAQAFYRHERNEIVFWETDYYGQCKSWALGAAGVLLAKFDVHSIHGACVEIDGPSFKKKGILIIAPTGSGKSTNTNVLARIHELDPCYHGRINSDDWVYVKDGVATPSEKNIYVRTNAVDDAVNAPDLSDTMARMKAIFDRAPCENVPIQNSQRLYSAVPNSRALINPARLSRLTYATSVKLVVLLRRDPDPNIPFFEELTAQQAVAILEEGRYMVAPGSGPKAEWGTIKNESWYNPYLLAADVAFERRKFGELQEIHGARFVIFNTSPAVAPQQFGITKPAEEITTHDIERTVEGTARMMLELLERTV